MDAKDLKSRLTEYDIKRILTSLGGIIWDEDDDKIILNTICHGGDSPNKLWYYKDTKSFYCFTECGNLGIFDIVCTCKDFTLPQSINYICTLLGISDMKYGFQDTSIEVIEDWSFINTQQKHYNNINKVKEVLKPLDINKLNMFQKIYSSDWIYDGISKEVMEHFDIMYSTLRQSIIIPHYNVTGDLVGIRQRATLDLDISLFGKYTPFSICNDMYNHKLTLNLYGINKNKDTIKRKKKVMLVESEKGVLQVATMFGVNENFSLALCGSKKVSLEQIKLLLDLGVNEVIIGLDRQYKEVGDKEYVMWSEHLRNKIIKPLLPYFNVYVLWDTEGLLNYKDSPCDRGEKVLLELMKNKIYIEG